jgi:hypothetical protein
MLQLLVALPARRLRQHHPVGNLLDRLRRIRLLSRDDLAVDKVHSHRSMRWPARFNSDKL